VGIVAAMGSAKTGCHTDNERTRTRPVLKALIIMGVVYCVLMACWPVVGGYYSRFYCAGANFLFGSFGSKGKVRFIEAREGDCDVKIRLFNVERRDERGRVQFAEVAHSCRHDGYIYTAFLIALILATPIPGRRKLWALVWGLILLHCFVVIKLAVRLVVAFSREPIRFFEISPFWRWCLYTFHQQFIVNITFGFVVATFVWILVSFRRGDWSRITSSWGHAKELGRPAKRVK